MGRRGAGWVGFGEGGRELEGLESEVGSHDSSVRSGRRQRWRMATRVVTTTRMPMAHNIGCLTLTAD